MLIDYNNFFYEYLCSKIKEFKIDYLNSTSPFLKNYIYLNNDIPIGLISYSLIYDRIELEYIWTDEFYRRKGIASILMNKMLGERFSNITLEVNVNNINAINLYNKFGFKIVSIRKKYYGNDDAYLMIREMI